MNKASRISIGQISRLAVVPLLSLALTQSALAAPIELNGAGVFRDHRGANSVRSEGDRLVWFANVSRDDGGLEEITDFPATGADATFLGNTTVVASNSTGFSRSLPEFFSYTAPTEFSRSKNYSDVPGAGSDWTFTAYNETDSASTVVSGIGNVGSLPLVRNATLNSGTNLNWDIPTTSETITEVRIQIIRESDGVSMYTSSALPANTTNFDLQNDIPSGLLENGELYTARIKLEDRSPGRLISRSSTFINFTPLPAGSPDVVLPTLDVDGKFNFDVDVTEAQPIILDPIVAIGYDYAVGAGDPLFTTVNVISDVGDGIYDLFLFDSVLSSFVDSGINLTAGVSFDFMNDLSAFGFANGALSQFSVRGIEESALLDPADTSAFMTQVTFNGTGSFTGTMTPVTADANIPAPGAALLIGLGLMGIRLCQRKRNS